MLTKVVFIIQHALLSTLHITRCHVREFYIRVEVVRHVQLFQLCVVVFFFYKPSHELDVSRKHSI